MPSSPALLADVLDTFRGLPTHVLLVHFTVVIATAGAAAGVVYAVVPRFRRWLSWPLVAVGVASVALGLITPSTGEALERHTPPSALLEQHTKLGGQMGTILIVYGILLVLAMVVVRFRPGTGEGAGPTRLARLAGMPGQTLDAFPGQAQLAVLLTALVLVGAVVSGIWIFRTGEAGSRSAWQEGAVRAPVVRV